METKYTIRIEKGDGSPGNKDGHRWTILLRGTVVSAGWDAGNKREARAEASRAMSDLGLRTNWNWR